MSADLLRRVSLLLCILGIASARTMAIETAGELFVDLDASTFNTGDQIWKNPGTYTDFEPVNDPQRAFNVGAIMFDGSSAFFGLDETPEGLTGIDPTRSIEVWAYNPSIAGEETLVSWGKRGGPDGTNMAFNYGNHELFGAVGHWGGNSPDMGWMGNPEDGTAEVGAPEPGEWHHLVYTYDEEVAKVYSDGELWNEEDMQQFGGLDTHFDTAIAIAAQWEGDGVTLTGGLRGNLSIGKVRIHDDILSEAQIKSNYDEEKGLFTVEPMSPPVIPELLSAGPINRYSFSNAATDDATDETVTDSVGGKDGTVLGEGSSFTGSELRLNGGGSDIAAYVDLPNGMISGLRETTIEGWATIEGEQAWARLFDFGSTEGGEIDEAGGGGQGQDYFVLTASRGTNISQQRLELRNLDPEFGGDEEGPVSDQQQIADTDVATEFDEEFHFAAVYEANEEDGGGRIVHYRNGEKVGQADVTIELGNINDVNNWLGRSNWTNDANFEGTFNEFRVYDYAFTEGQAFGSFNAGPDQLNLGGPSGDVNGDGVSDAADIDALAAAVQQGSQDAIFDLNGDGNVNADDRKALVTGADFLNTWIGDSNLNGEFSSGDLVEVFGAGKYETGDAASWAQGDWDGDGVFGSGDLVAAFQDGGFEQGPKVAAAVPEPSSVVLLATGLLFFARRRRR